MVTNTWSLGFQFSINLCRNTLSIHPQCTKSSQISNEAQESQCPSQIPSAHSCIPLRFAFTHRNIISHSVPTLWTESVQARPYGLWRSLFSFHPKPGGPCCKYWNINGNLLVAIEQQSFLCDEREGLCCLLLLGAHRTGMKKEHGHRTFSLDILFTMKTGRSTEPEEMVHWCSVILILMPPYRRLF